MSDREVDGRRNNEKLQVRIKQKVRKTRWKVGSEKGKGVLCKKRRMKLTEKADGWGREG